MAGGTREPLRIGFLLSIELADHGYIGGLLVTNHLGRPLEFQCTTPVQPNRTQKILYGPTLVPFIMTELLGQTLLERVGVKPHVVITEHSDMLDLRKLVDIPLLCILDDSAGVLASESQRDLGRQTVTTHSDFVDDFERIEGRLRLLPADVDLQEPFDRVRDALTEAHGAVKKAFPTGTPAASA